MAEQITMFSYSSAKNEHKITGDDGGTKTHVKVCTTTKHLKNRQATVNQGSLEAVFFIFFT